jgi:hypothetical protein
MSAIRLLDPLAAISSQSRPCTLADLRLIERYELYYRFPTLADSSPQDGDELGGQSSASYRCTACQADLPTRHDAEQHMTGS